MTEATKATPTPAHGARAHARFSPSATKRWMTCPGAVQLAEENTEPEERSGDSRRGELGHEASEVWLRRRLVPTDAQLAAEHPDLDPELYDLVRFYVGDMLLDEKIAAQTDPEVELLVETRTNLTKDCWGTFDSALSIPLVRLVVSDLKCGHETVYAERNPAMLTYAAALLTERLGPVDEVELRIYQPREGVPHRDVWKCTMLDVDAHRESVLQAIKAAKKKNAKEYLVAGDHCTFCRAAFSRAKGQCPAKKAALHAAFPALPGVVEGREAATVPAESLTPEQRARIAAAAPILKEWLAKVEAWNLASPPPGFKVVEGQSRRSWRKDMPEADIAAALEAAGAPGYRQVLPTLGDVEKAMGGKKAAAPVLVGLTVKPAGARTLVPADDPRLAIEVKPFPALPAEAPVSDHLFD